MGNLASRLGLNGKLEGKLKLSSGLFKIVFGIYTIFSIVIRIDTKNNLTP
jgi:hypothetical protein